MSAVLTPQAKDGDKSITSLALRVSDSGKQQQHKKVTGNKWIPRSVDAGSLGALALLVDDGSLGDEDDIGAAVLLLELTDELGLRPVEGEI